MTDDDSGATGHRRRRFAAHEHAASVHERAARTHDEAAELYDRLGLDDRADEERAKADRERREAVADHDAARREGDDDNLQH